MSREDTTNGTIDHFNLHSSLFQRPRLGALNALSCPEFVTRLDELGQSRLNSSDNIPDSSLTFTDHSLDFNTCHTEIFQVQGAHTNDDNSSAPPGNGMDYTPSDPSSATFVKSWQIQDDATNDAMGDFNHHSFTLQWPLLGAPNPLSLPDYFTGFHESEGIQLHNSGDITDSLDTVLDPYLGFNTGHREVSPMQGAPTNLSNSCAATGDGIESIPRGSYITTPVESWQVQHPATQFLPKDQIVAISDSSIWKLRDQRNKKLKRKALLKRRYAFLFLRSLTGLGSPKSRAHTVD